MSSKFYILIGVVAASFLMLAVPFAAGGDGGGIRSYG